MISKDKREFAREILSVLRTAKISDAEILEEIVSMGNIDDLLGTLEMITLMRSVARKPHG